MKLEDTTAGRDLACLMVGKFMRNLAFLERALDQYIMHVLDMVDVKGLILTSNLDMRKKINTARSLSVEALTHEDESRIADTWSELHDLYNMRNIVAHRFFSIRGDKLLFSLAKAEVKFDISDIEYSYLEFTTRTDRAHELAIVLLTFEKNAKQAPSLLRLLDLIDDLPGGKNT